MSDSLDDIIQKFDFGDDEFRLELLLDYAKKLPALAERFHAERDAGLGRVPECMTPVFLWMENDEDGRLRFHVDVAEEAPTVRGILSIIVDAYDGGSACDAAELPTDLIKRLQLDGQIRMQRAVGLAAIIGRIRRQATELVEQNGAIS